MAILVTGGAGYVGSIVCESLLDEGEIVVVLDNLSRGHREAVPSGCTFYAGDIGDCGLVQTIVERHGVDACLHFAALAYVGESTSSPGLYYDHNVARSIRLFNTLRETGVVKIVTSSSCATYGDNPAGVLIESSPQRPLSPYGWSKLMCEQVLRSYDAAYSVRHVALRYFNAGGATPLRGEDHNPEPHLIPRALLVALGQQESITIHGTEFQTRDGTAVRDYVHVGDLARAHVLALQYLRSGGKSESINLGAQRGHSVAEVIEVCKQVTGRTIDVRRGSRRGGDPDQLVANCEKAFRLLNWKPVLSDLPTIVESAWVWHQAHPFGYGADHPPPVFAAQTG